jgi:gliding motility-associated-like protein
VDTINLDCQNATNGACFATPTDNSGPYNFVWTNASNDTVKTSLGLEDSLTNLGAGTYVVTVTNTIGCTQTHVYTVTAPVYNAAFSYAPGLICQGTTVSFSDLSTGTIQDFTWSFGDGTSSTLENPTHLYNTPGQYTVTLIIRLSADCFDTALQVITVNPNIVVETSVDEPPYCVGESIQFTDLSVGNPGEWSWSFGDGATSSVQNPTHVFNAEGAYEVVVFISDQFCGTGADSFILSLYAVPDPKLRDDTLLCGGEIQLLNANAQGSSYLWSTNETTPEIAFVMPNEDVTVWVKVDNNGCTGYDSVFFKNKCVMVVPSAFSPNSDGSNDWFRPLGSSINQFDFRIYNRWGQEVFVNTSGNIHDGWDGKLEGEEQPVGVYVYLLNGTFISGEVFSLQGNVTLVR